MINIETSNQIFGSKIRYKVVVNQANDAWLCKRKLKSDKRRVNRNRRMPHSCKFSIDGR